MTFTSTRSLLGNIIIGICRQPCKTPPRTLQAVQIFLIHTATQWPSFEDPTTHSNSRPRKNFLIFVNGSSRTYTWRSLLVSLWQTSLSLGRDFGVRLLAINLVLSRFTCRAFKRTLAKMWQTSKQTRTIGMIPRHRIKQPPSLTETEKHKFAPSAVAQRISKV